MWQQSFLVFVGAGLLLLLAFSTGTSLHSQGDAFIVKRVSVASDGTPGTNASHSPATSNDGRFIAFYSAASNLVPEDTNRGFDIFVHDQDTGATTRVTVDSSGNQGNNDSRSPSISADGQLVVFESLASNLVAGDTNGVSDIFIHDLEAGTTERVSVASNGSQGNGESRFPAISGNGRFVAFESQATNLAPGDTNAVKDIFLHDLRSGISERVSLASNGSQGSGASIAPSITADGRFIAFASLASNLVPGDNNGSRDVLVHDRNTRQTLRISENTMGHPANSGSFIPSLSSDGRFVAFESFATNLATGDSNGRFDIFVKDWQTGSSQLVSVASNGAGGNQNSGFPSISADGRFVVFESGASNLVPEDTNGRLDVFVHNRETGAIARVSVASDGSQGNFGSLTPSLSADGRFVAFVSQATNLVPGDANRNDDIFLAANPLFESASTLRPDTRATPTEALRSAANATPTPRDTNAPVATPSATPVPEPAAGGGCTPLARGAAFADVGWLVLGLVLLQLGLIRRRRR